MEPKNQDKYQGTIKLWVWDIAKTKYITLYKHMALPFQPQKGLKLHAGVNNMQIHNVEWYYIDDKWEFQAQVVISERETMDSFLDMYFYSDLAINDGFKQYGDLEWADGADDEFITYCFPYDYSKNLEAINKDNEERYKEAVLNAIVKIENTMTTQRSPVIISSIIGAVVGVFTLVILKY
jgi:hypothetical protein